MSKQPNIAVLGAGYWGKNLVRNVAELGHLHAIADENKELVEKIAAQHSPEKTYTSSAECLEDPAVDAVVIATPAASHFEIAKQALEKGKDVMVEKPLAIRLEHGKELIEIAKANGRILMVGHLLQYHPVVLKMKEMISSGEVGKLEYMYSNRVNLGKIRTVENILWSFAPHDISTMLFFVEDMPLQTNAIGGSYLQPNVADTTVTTLLFDSGVRAHIYVSWLHPFKEQRMVVVGSKKMLVFDDRAPADEKLMAYDKKVSQVDGQFVAEKPEGVPIKVDQSTEPLRAECQHFIECVQTRNTPRTDGEEGLRVLRVLQSSQKSLSLNGQPVQLPDGSAA